MCLYIGFVFLEYFVLEVSFLVVKKFIQVRLLNDEKL